MSSLIVFYMSDCFANINHVVCGNKCKQIFRLFCSNIFPDLLRKHLHHAHTHKYREKRVKKKYMFTKLSRLSESKCWQWPRLHRVFWQTKTDDSLWNVINDPKNPALLLSCCSLQTAFIALACCCYCRRKCIPWEGWNLPCFHSSNDLDDETKCKVIFVI